MFFSPRQPLPFTFKTRTSARTRRLRITIYPGGKVVVSHPRRTSNHSVTRFLVLHTAWVLQEIQRMKQVSTIQNFMRGTKKEYENEKENARGHITSRVTYWNAHYGYTYGRIAIKNMTTRWGSCSQKGNLNFHYKAMYLPSDLLDYLVVHELCHLREMNHGPAFWALVAKTIPAYKEQRRRLRVIASHTLNMPGMKKYDA